MVMVNNSGANVVLNDHQFVNQASRNIGNAISTFNNYSQVAGAILGDITPQQASGLGSLSVLSLVILYLNLPNCNRTTFYGINNTMGKTFVSRHPFLLEVYQQIKAELAQWDPSFSETALLTAMTLINGYSGNDPTVGNFQQQMTNACNLNLWKLSNGDLACFEQLHFRFGKMMNLLKKAKFGILSALQSSSKNSPFIGNLSTSMQNAEFQGKMLIEKQQVFCQTKNNQTNSN